MHLAHRFDLQGVLVPELEQDRTADPTVPEKAPAVVETQKQGRAQRGIPAHLILVNQFVP